MNEKVLFVGGPVDGRREAIPEDVKVVALEAFAFGFFEAQPMKTVIYKKHVIRFQDGDVTIAVIDGLTPFQAFEQMCDKYPPQFGQDLNAG